MRRAIVLWSALGAVFAANAQGPPQYPYYPPSYYQPQQSYPQQLYYSQQRVYPQQPAYSQQTAPAAQFSAQQLTNLVAPVALYPDMLLSEILAASTYPLELVQAEQWVRANAGLDARALLEAAKQQNWDPSVQALVAFPDVLNLLTRDIQWTTDLGNAFLAQQAEVMDAIQQLRAEARADGRLTDTPRQRIVVDQSGPGPGAIEIQPSDPQLVYPPVYNPEYVWGPPAYGAYPPLGYPAPDYGIGYAAGTVLSALFTGLWSYGGWGWGLSWLTHGLFLNGLFFSHFGFHGYGGGSYGGGGYAGGRYGGESYAGHSVWTHDPAHRLGVPYGNRHAAERGNYSARSFYNARSYSDNRLFGNRLGSYYGSRQASNRQTEAYRGLTESAARGNGYAGYGSAYRGGSWAARASSRNYPAHGFGSNYSASHFSAPRYSERHNSAPRSSSHFGGGEHFGGYSFHSGGGHSGGGGHSHGGSHHHR